MNIDDIAEIELPIRSCFAQSHAKYTVGPLEVDASNVKITAQWIEMEKVVLNTPRFIVFEWINDNTVTTQIRNVSISIVTLIFRNVDNLLNEMRERDTHTHIIQYEIEMVVVQNEI